MLYNIPAVLLVGVLFIGIILFYLLGLRAMRYKMKKDPSYSPDGIGPLEGAVLGLLSLLLAFTFNQSASHYDVRRDLLIEESNDIGTALFRSALYPDSLKIAFRNDFKDYIVARIAYYEAGTNEDRIFAALQEANDISTRIWQRASYISQLPGNATRSMQMIPAINKMVDGMSTREEARKKHVPESILWLLSLLCITGSFIVGYASKSRKIDYVILCTYSLMTVMTIYFILDLDRPRRGIITTRSAHRNIYGLLNYLQDNEGATK
ncbi:MAG: hypothetical protein CVU77_06500 [Elusimicrobia bacterium HGW-Elusimicrobia-1]|jgi:hypothetical protein|nr:MAG: hypothetical protein CVU77_06500 [Elusimicrobia bacterium HGW-Elusimicrobia-1]